ncbi:hypothetical protein RYX36_016046 [Vicia faba]
MQAHVHGLDIQNDYQYLPWDNFHQLDHIYGQRRGSQQFHLTVVYSTLKST